MFCLAGVDGWKTGNEFLWQFIGKIVILSDKQKEIILREFGMACACHYCNR
jgi:hypothetical protein